MIFLGLAVLVTVSFILGYRRGWRSANRNLEVYACLQIHTIMIGKAQLTRSLRADEIASILKIPKRHVFWALADLERGGYVEGSPDPNITSERLAARGGRAPSVWRVKG